jgi:Xaa-Pro aminopeptidase
VNSGIPAARYADRIERTKQALDKRGDDALLIGVGADLRWLTGYDAKALERLTMLVLRPGTDPAVLVVPRLEVGAAKAAPAVGKGIVELRSWEETESPYELVARTLESGALADTGAGSGWGSGSGAGSASGSGGRDGEPGPRDDAGRLLVSDGLRAAFLLNLQWILPEATFGLSSDVLTDLRRIKDPEEVELLRRAAHAADRTILAIAQGRLVGRSERDVEREVQLRLVEEGHDQGVFSIVGSGPNSASPHHEPSDRVIGAGEALVLDIGGTIAGYGSDITRTFWIRGEDGSGPPAEFERLYEVLQRAQASATDAVKPGVPCEDIDAVARSIINEAGYGERFIHRTGHGIGLEGHEHPYLVAGNRERLHRGDAFSVEPGIYFEGRFGARIEDIVVCGANGPDTLNEATRDLLIVDG